jgi:hypothetical protein
MVQTAGGRGARRPTSCPQSRLGHRAQKSGSTRMVRVALKITDVVRTSIALGTAPPHVVEGQATHPVVPPEQQCCEERICLAAGW